MDFALTPPTDAVAPEDEPAATDLGSGFSISEQPLVSSSEAGETEASGDLPPARGNEPLYLLVRDPHSLFAYWDLDWTIAFGDPAPRERDVLLRVAKRGEPDAKSMTVQPRGGSYLVEDLEADTAYSATLGYHASGGEWVALAVSTEVTTPAAEVTDTVDADFATVPFHMSFQRMLELLRAPKQESLSLTAMLNDLRERDESRSAEEAEAGQSELVHAIRQAVAQHPPPNGAASIAQLWTPELIGQVMGGVGGSASPQSGFGGSSRTT